MEIGKLNRRITIQMRDSGEDEAGQPIQTWTTFTKTWCDPRGYTGLGRIRVTGTVPADAKNVSFRIRYRADLNFAMRVCFNDANDDPIESDPYDITHVELDHQRHEWTDLVSAGGVNDG